MCSSLFGFLVPSVCKQAGSYRIHTSHFHSIITCTCMHAHSHVRMLPNHGGWAALGCTGLGWAGLGSGLGGLGWAGLDWAGLGRAGLGWAGLGLG